MAAAMNLSMAERLSANMKLTAKLGRARPDLGRAELRQQANTMESEIYKSCSTSDDYQSLVEAALNTLASSENDSGPSTPTSDSFLPEVDGPVDRIGPYAAIYHASGLFSTIYRSTLDKLNGKSIAIKLTTPSTMTAPHNSRREARLLRAAAHDSIVPVFSSESIPGGRYIMVMPFLPYDLASLLDRGCLNKSQIRSHLRSLFEALAHCHSLGILHRDVKPSNLLLASASGPAFLADFGIAWKDGDPDSEPADDKITDIGTTSYRAPELLFGNSAYGIGVDLWAAGCVVVEAENDGKALFDSGDLGSELALIKSIFSTLGTPTNTTWPEAGTFPDWGKMAFKDYPSQPWQSIIPKASGDCRDLVQSIIRYESGQRLFASEALKHSYFHEANSSMQRNPHQ